MKIWDGKLVFHFMPRNRERWSLNILLCTAFQVVLRLFRLDVGNALCDFDGRITSGFFNYKGGTPETPPPPVERRIKPGLNRVKQGSRLLNRKGHSCLGLGAIHLPKRSLSASNTPPPPRPPSTISSGHDTVVLEKKKHFSMRLRVCFPSNPC